MSRVARMSRVGSPSTITRSARRPAAMRPRSSSLKRRAGTDVAAASASLGERPARTSSSSSPCMLAPWVVPGLPASVPARMSTPAACSVRTLAMASARMAGLAAPPKPAFSVSICPLASHGLSRASSPSMRPSPVCAIVASTDSVGITNALRCFAAAKNAASPGSPNMCTRPSALAAIAALPSLRRETCTTASLRAFRAAAIADAACASVMVGMRAVAL